MQPGSYDWQTRVQASATCQSRTHVMILLRRLFTSSFRSLMDATRALMIGRRACKLQLRHVSQEHRSHHLPVLIVIYGDDNTRRGRGGE